MCAPQHSPSQPHYHKHRRASYSIGGNTSQNTENNNSVILTTYNCLHQWTIQTFRQSTLVFISEFTDEDNCRLSKRLNCCFQCSGYCPSIKKSEFPVPLRSILYSRASFANGTVPTANYSNCFHSHMLVIANQMYIFAGPTNGLVIDMLIRFNCTIKLMRNNNSVCNQFDCAIFYTCTHKNVPQQWLMFCCPHNVGTSGNWGLEQERAFVFALYVAMATSTSLSKVGPASPNHAYSHLTRVYAWTICSECMHELCVVSACMNYV